jgi:hypothetical protein
MLIDAIAFALRFLKAFLVCRHFPIAFIFIGREPVKSGGKNQRNNDVSNFDQFSSLPRGANSLMPINRTSFSPF